MARIERVVFTGTMSKSRAHMESEAALWGVDSEPRVTRRTTHLVVGKNAGDTKLNAAKKFGIPVLTEAEFRAQCDPQRDDAPDSGAEAKAPVAPMRSPHWIEALQKAQRSVGF